VTVSRKRYLWPLGAGLIGAAILAVIYLGLVSLAESPRHALELFWEDRLFVLPILLGFGTQVGLFTFLKLGLFVPTASPVNGATTAAGGGVSTVAMVACCAHHLTDVLPVLGLTAAATFLAEWKVPFLAVGLLTNLIGIGLMLREIRKARQHALACAVAPAV
jgi:hypothetical protein